MKTEIIVTGILKCKDEFLVVKRSDNDLKYPGAWEFPGGHLEFGETLKEGLKRELNEEVGFIDKFIPIITHYSDSIIEENGEIVHELEIDFYIEVAKEKLNIQLSSEHVEYKWVKKDSRYLDQYIKNKVERI